MLKLYFAFNTFQTENERTPTGFRQKENFYFFIQMEIERSFEFLY